MTDFEAVIEFVTKYAWARGYSRITVNAKKVKINAATAGSEVAARRLRGLQFV